MPSRPALPLSVPVWLRICDVLLERNDMTTLTTLMCVSDATYDLAGPFVYRAPIIHGANIRSFLLGLKPALRQGPNPPPPKKRCPDQRTVVYRPTPDTQVRKIRLLANITELELKKPKYTGAKRGPQLDRQTPVLKWCLKHATHATSSATLLPRLQKIAFVNYPNDHPHPRYPNTSLLVILDPVGQVSSSYPPLAASVTPTPRWDICIKVHSMNCWDSPASLGLVDWLNGLLGRGALRNLSIHYDDAADFLPLRMSPWSGTLRVVMGGPEPGSLAPKLGNDQETDYVKAELYVSALMYLVDLIRTSRCPNHPIQISLDGATGSSRSIAMEGHVQRMVKERVGSRTDNDVRSDSTVPESGPRGYDGRRVGISCKPTSSVGGAYATCDEVTGAGVTVLSC